MNEPMSTPAELLCLGIHCLGFLASAESTVPAHLRGKGCQCETLNSEPQGESEGFHSALLADLE